MKMHSFMVSEDVHAYFKQLADRYDRTASELYRKALDEFVERERKKSLTQSEEPHVSTE